MKRETLLQEDSVYLQMDGSLELQCHITIDSPIFGASLGSVARLRFSGEDSDFSIFSPEGREYKVRMNVYCICWRVCK